MAASAVAGSATAPAAAMAVPTVSFSASRRLPAHTLPVNHNDGSARGERLLPPTWSLPHLTSVISRRHLLALAGAVPVATALGAAVADARPIVYTDDHRRAFGPVVLIGDSLSGGYIGGLRQEL